MKKNDTENKQKPACCVWLGWVFAKILFGLTMIAAGAIGMFIFLNLSAFILPESFLGYLTGADAVLTNHLDKTPLNAEEKKALLLLVDKGRVLTQDQFLSMLSQFYNSTINTLIVVISLLGVIAYFSISSLSRRHAEELAEKCAEREIRQKLSDDEYVKKLLSKSDELNELIDGSRIRDNIVGDVEDKVKKFEDRLRALEYWLMSSQPDEEKGKRLVEGASEDGNNQKK